MQRSTSWSVKIEFLDIFAPESVFFSPGLDGEGVRETPGLSDALVDEELENGGELGADKHQRREAV